jgi:hypothetical protein
MVASNFFGWLKSLRTALPVGVSEAFISSLSFADRENKAFSEAENKLDKKIKVNKKRSVPKIYK